MTENVETLGNKTRLYQILALQYDVKMTNFRFLSLWGTESSFQVIRWMLEWHNHMEQF